MVLNHMHKITTLKYYFALLITAVITLHFSWVGFTSSDDAYYITSGLGWLHEFPYVPTHFGTIRTAVGIPIALMFALFGESEFTATLSTCIFLIATAFLTMKMLTRLIGQHAAFITSVLLVTIPLFAVHSTIPCADMPELFFVASSFWLFWLACQKQNRLGLLLLAGICAACAFSAHELTVGLLIYYGILFSIGFGIKRNEYWLMAIGFLIIISIECSYYWVITGDPLYRFTLLLQGTSIQDRNETGALQLSDSGTLHVWTPIDPLLMLFTNHYFSLLGFLMVPTLWWSIIEDWRNQTLYLKLSRLLLGLGIIWILLVAIELRNLKLLPRYYIVPAYCFFVASAIWIYVKIWPFQRKLAVNGIVVFILVNIGLILADNKNPRFGERALVEYLSNTTGYIHTDPLTAHNAEFFCRWTNQDCRRLVTTPPTPGSTFFYNPITANRPNRYVPPDKVKQYMAKEQWQEIWKKQAPRKVAAVLAEKTGIISLLPQVLISKIEGPNTAVFTYKLSE